MQKIIKLFRKRIAAETLFLGAVMAFCSCSKAVNPGAQTASISDGNDVQLQQNMNYDQYDSEPYAVRTFLKDYAFVNTETGTGFYGRYTELKVEGKAPETFCNAIAKCNQRAEEAVKTRGDLFKKEGTFSDAETDGYQYVTYGYISTVTRADHTAFSILETEFEKGIGQHDSDIDYQFHGSTYDTENGEEISLADLAWDETTCSGMLKEALSSKYGIENLAETASSDYAWIADAVGIRFYFNSDAVSRDQRRAIGDYSARAVNTSFPYKDLPGEKVKSLQAAPESYIAMIDRETVYDLPHGDLSVLLMKQEDSLIIRITKNSGETNDLSIEYADDLSDFYIIRSNNGFYLFRERIGYQEGFFYDFAKPDGGFGRFAYNTSQYFDSFLREIQVALPYNPYCVHMAEVKRSFGESGYGKSSFIPNGHYLFPSDPKARYKRFLLTDNSLQIDSYNMACRLLEDFTATEIGGDGNEIGEITVPAGKTLLFDSVTGEASRYDDPPKRSQTHTYFYNCLLTDGTRIRFESDVESSVSVNGAFLNRFAVPISLGEAQFENPPEESEAFTVQIGGKDYPLIPDYSLINHTGEEIDFGNDIWWKVEEYPGNYVCTDEDWEELQDEFFVPVAPEGHESRPELTISEDGEAVFNYSGQIFKGKLPEKRYYKSYVNIFMVSETQQRSFQIALREGEYHSSPQKIEFYSEGEPATNEPSKVPPILVYLTRVSE